MLGKKSFKLRAFISLYMTISSIIILISGIILYIAPPGRIAHWSYWSMLGLTKSDWQALHIIFTFIIVIASIFHIMMNIKPLLSYFSTKFGDKTSVRKELTYSLLITLFIFAGTYFQIPPFSSVINWGEEITDSWADESNEPPIPHAEELTISEIALQLNLKTENVMQKLNRSGYAVSDSTVTLKEVAEKYDVVPSEVYLKIANRSNPTISNTNSTGTYRAGSGYGRKLLSEIFKENNITWKDGIEQLKKNDIIVTEDGKLKDIASNNNKLPMDVINALQLGEH
jgi:hypothetical protein